MPDNLGLIFTALGLAVLVLGGCGDSASPPSKASSPNITAAPTPPPGVAREELMFKGVPIGKPAQVEAVLALWTKKNNTYGSRPKRLDKDNSLSFSVAYGHFEATPTFTFGKDGTLDQVYFGMERDTLARLIGTLSETYGPPELEKSGVSNAMGAKFNRMDATWTDARGNQLNVRTINLEVDKGSFWLRSADKIKGDHQESARKEAAAKKNI